MTDLEERAKKELGFGGKEIDTPDWEEDTSWRTHNWRNHVGETTKAIWHTFTREQKAAIALDAQQEADREDWD